MSVYCTKSKEADFFSFYNPEVQVSDRLLVMIYSLHGAELVYVDSVSVLASVQH